MSDKCINKISVKYICSISIKALIIAAVISYVLGGSGQIRRVCSEEKVIALLIGFLCILMAVNIVVIYEKWKKHIINQNVTSVCDNKIESDGFKMNAFKDKLTAFVNRYNINKIDLIIVSISVVIGSTLRIPGCNWGIYAGFQPDEGSLVVPSVEMLDAGELYHCWYAYPAQFVSKINTVCMYIYRAITGTQFTQETFNTYILCRVNTAIIGVFTIITAFLIGNYLKKHLGSVFAVLVCVFPYFVQYSLQVTGDITGLFFASLVMLFSLRYMDEKSNRYVIFMTMAAAMSTLEKWHGGALTVYIACIILFYNKSLKDFFIKGVLALFSYVGWITILAPNVIMNINDAFNGAKNTAVWYEEGHPSFIQNMSSYLNCLYGHIGGVIFIGAAIAGLVFFIIVFKKKSIILLPGIIKVVILCFMNRAMYRWELELMFDSLLVIAFLSVYLFEINKYKAVTRVVSVVVTLIVVVTLFSGSFVIWSISVNSKNDIRVAEKKICEEYGITTENCAAEWYTALTPNPCWTFDGKMCKVIDIGFETIYVEDGVLYKNCEDIDYLICNLNYYPATYEKKKEILEKYPELVIYYDEAEYGDVFSSPLGSINSSVNDFKIVYDNICAGIKVMNGATIGHDDSFILNIKNVPYKEKICNE